MKYTCTCDIRSCFNLVAGTIPGSIPCMVLPTGHLADDPMILFLMTSWSFSRGAEEVYPSGINYSFPPLLYIGRPEESRSPSPFCICTAMTVLCHVLPWPPFLFWPCERTTAVCALSRPTCTACARGPPLVEHLALRRQSFGMSAGFCTVCLVQNPGGTGAAEVMRGGGRGQATASAASARPPGQVLEAKDLAARGAGTSRSPMRYPWLLRKAAGTAPCCVCCPPHCLPKPHPQPFLAVTSTSSPFLLPHTLHIFCLFTDTHPPPLLPSLVFPGILSFLFVTCDA